MGYFSSCAEAVGYDVENTAAVISLIPSPQIPRTMIEIHFMLFCWGALYAIRIASGERDLFAPSNFNSEARELACLLLLLVGLRWDIVIHGLHSTVWTWES